MRSTTRLSAGLNVKDVAVMLQKCCRKITNYLTINNFDGCVTESLLITHEGRYYVK